MTKETLKKRFEDLLEYLPEKLKSPLISLDEEMKVSVEEIRLRAGRPLSVTVGGTQFFVKNDGAYMLPKEDCIAVLTDDIKETFFKLCHNSVYSHNEELCEGYILLKNGHRAGVCGRVTMRYGKIETIREISSINIRVAKEVPNFADELVKRYTGGGVLICGGPSTGKTTLLRDFVRQLASGITGKFLKVAVIDSRGEIAASLNGVPMIDIGSTADIITSCPKAQGIEMALRTLNPDVIVFDELGNSKEVEAVEQSFNSGVSVVATAHAGDIWDIFRRKPIELLLHSGAIEQVVLCQNKSGFSYSIYSIEEIKKHKDKMVAV